jgi:hypothetical protein
MREMNQPDSRLPAALRRLGSIAPRGAPLALGDLLKDEFRRHHIRCRRNRNARILLAAACVAASLGAFLILRPRPSNMAAIHESLQTTPPSQANILVGLTEPKSTRPKAVKSHASNRNRKNPVTAENRFVALPTFNPAIPIDHLQMIRLDLPGRDLRLVGFPVREEIADRRIVADVLLAQDGTPYALRLVQNSRFKEQ